MEEDSLYPNDSSYFLPREPSDQIIERKKEKAQTLESLNELKSIANRLQERIDFYEKNSSIPDDVRTDPQQFLILHNTYTLVAENLKSEKEFIDGLITSYLKR